MQSGDSIQLPFEERRILSVSGLNREAQALIEGTLGLVWVEGEVSNLSRPSSGHLYWSLKDAHAQVRCAMFRMSNRGLGFELANGQQILVRARASLYEARGEYQLIVEYAEEAGEGAAAPKIRGAQAQARGRGLFDAARKRVPPKLPRRIGVDDVADRRGAARRADRASAPLARDRGADLSHLRARRGAADEICRTLKLADRRAECDVLILTRGGGSLEDLWAFNEEKRRARDRRARAADHRRRRPRDRLHDRGLRSRPARADAVAGRRARGAGSDASGSRASRGSSSRSRYCTRRRLGDGPRHFATLAHRLSRCHPGHSAARAAPAARRARSARCAARSSARIANAKLRLERLATSVAHANPAHRLAKTRERWRWTAERLAARDAARNVDAHEAAPEARRARAARR